MLASSYTATTFMVDYANVEFGLSFKRLLLGYSPQPESAHGSSHNPRFSDQISRKLRMIVSVKGLLFLSASIALIDIFSGCCRLRYGPGGGHYFRRGVISTAAGVWIPSTDWEQCGQISLVEECET